MEVAYIYIFTSMEANSCSEEESNFCAYFWIYFRIFALHSNISSCIRKSEKNGCDEINNLKNK